MYSSQHRQRLMVWRNGCGGPRFLIIGAGEPQDIKRVSMDTRHAFGLTGGGHYGELKSVAS